MPTDLRAEASADSAPRSRVLTLPRVWVLAAVLLAVALNQSGMVSVDLAYQLRAGEHFLQTHQLLRTDSFTYTASHLHWTDQQWAAQAFFAEIFRHLGWAGLGRMEWLVVAAIFAFVLS